MKPLDEVIAEPRTQASELIAESEIISSEDGTADMSNAKSIIEETPQTG